MIIDVGKKVLGAAEIGRMLGVSRQRVQQIISRNDFPQPWEELAMGKIWLPDDVRRWAEARGRTLVEDEEPTE